MLSDRCQIVIDLHVGKHHFEGLLIDEISDGIAPTYRYIFILVKGGFKGNSRIGSMRL